MKNSAVLASLLFGALAVAAPFDKRALVYKTEVLTETVIVYTTVYDDEPVATSSVDALFYEQPTTTSSSAVVVPTSSATPAYVAPVSSEEPSSSVYTPAPETPSSTPVAVVTSAAAVVETPTTTEAYVAPAATSAAAVESEVSSGSTTTSGETYSDVDITIYDNNGGYGACGTELHDTDMIVALAKDAWGTSTYDVMTGEATNPWCGQKIQIEYNGNSVQATIMDLCPGCVGHDVDLSLAAWKQLTGLDEKTRLKASWSKVA
ncbi:Nn.00g065080.m01.CDS01 [Neocucurbitaria sp. VM-36]